MNRRLMCLCSNAPVFTSDLPRGSGGGAFRKKRFDCVTSGRETVFSTNLCSDFSGPL